MDRPHFVSGFLVLLLLGQTSCIDPSAGQDVAVRTDSAGVEIIEHSVARLSSLPSWRLPDAPSLEIGATDGPEEYLFHEISGGMILPGDTVLVVNGGSSEIRFYDPQGRFLRKSGGRGEGPGEFLFPSGVWTIGDSLAFWDSGTDRVSFFDRTGQFLRLSVPEQRTGTSELLGMFFDGTFLIQSRRYGGGNDAFNPMILELTWFDSRGGFLDSLPEHPHSLTGLLGESGLIGGPLFGLQTSTAADAQSYWIGSGQEPAVLRYTRDGQLAQIIRWPDGERMVSQDEVDSYFENLLLRLGEDRRGRIEVLRRSMPVAEQFPVFESLRPARNGNLWIKLYRRPSDEGPDHWLILDSRGELAAKLEMPKEMRILEIGEDYVAVVRENELGVEHFAVYPIQKDTP